MINEYFVNGRKNFKMIGYYNYTVILTYIGTISGFLGIAYIGNGELKASLLCLICCGLCDMFDGKIASTMKRTAQEKRFGIQIDSLSDVICFGVLPALIVLKESGGGVVFTGISAIYMLCALIRLSWFNVDEEERQNKEDCGRHEYLGLPVTTSALLIPFIMGSSNLMLFDADKIYPWILLAVAAAFIAPFRMNKPGIIGKIVMIVMGVLCLALVLVGVPS